jgi:hypothetical protein
VSARRTGTHARTNTTVQRVAAHNVSPQSRAHAHTHLLSRHTVIDKHALLVLVLAEVSARGKEVADDVNADTVVVNADTVVVVSASDDVDCDAADAAAADVTELFNTAVSTAPVTTIDSNTSNATSLRMPLAALALEPLSPRGENVVGTVSCNHTGFEPLLADACINA